MDCFGPLLVPSGANWTLTFVSLPREFLAGFRAEHWTGLKLGSCYRLPDVRASAVTARAPARVAVAL